MSTNPNRMVRNSVESTQAGVALVLALAVLALMGMLGTAYLTYVSTETERVKLEAQAIRLDTLAERGIQATIGQLGELVAEGDDIPEARDYTDSDLALYWAGIDGDGTPVPNDVFRAKANVAISDESAKVNLNHAPARVLEVLLGLDAATAESVRKSLPAPGAKPDETHRWFTDVDELVTRGFVRGANLPPQYEDLVTVDTAPNPANIERLINVNKAPAPVLAALFNIDVNRARRVIEQRPFTSLNEVQMVVGKDPSTFNLAQPGATSAAMPQAVGLKSRCFRLRCQAEIEKLQGTGWKSIGSRTIEAVVLFDDAGRGEIVKWQAMSGAERAASQS